LLINVLANGSFVLCMY